MQTLTITTLRQHLYHVVDEIIATGKPVVIERKGSRVLLTLEQKGSKFANLKKHQCINGDLNEIIDMEITQWDEPNKL